MAPALERVNGNKEGANQDVAKLILTAQPAEIATARPALEKLTKYTGGFQRLAGLDALVVAAGKQTEIIFQNDDVMPHNLIIVENDRRAIVGMKAMTTGGKVIVAKERGRLSQGKPHRAAKRALHACGEAVRKTCVTRFESPSSRRAVFVC